MEPRVRSVARAFDLLELFDHRRPRLRLKEIAERTGLPKTTVVRLLADLVERGVVASAQDGHYTVGATLLGWVRLSAALWRVDEHTTEVMRELVHRHGETVNVYVRQDLTRVSIAQEEGTATVRNVVEVGRPMPLTAGAASYVLLAAVPDVVDRLVAADPELDAARLRERVAGAGRDGYAISDGDREIGAAAAAVAVHSRRDGRVIAALSMSGPSSRFTGRRLEAGLAGLHEAAHAVSEAGMGNVEGLL
ncbi:IclR family transcriptional regulator [Pseudonocardia sichuanensis]